MKKIISILLCLILTLGCASSIFAEEDAALKAIYGTTLISAKPITVYVTVNDMCQLATTKDGKLAARLEVREIEGANLDEVFKALHMLYCAEGEEGYQSESTDFGISMMKAWGKDNGTAYGYYINHEMAFDCSGIVNDGDEIDLFVYKDMATYSDLYTSIDSVPSTVEGESLVSVKYYYFDETFALKSAALEGAEIYEIKNGKMVASGIKTDKNGQCYLSPADGTELLAAVKEDCVVSVAEPNVYKQPVFEDFTDLKVGEWYDTAIRYALENKICNGTGNNIFAPGREITKAEVLQMLWKLDGELQADLLMNYDDVEEDQWYTEAIRWALAKGIIEPKTEKEVGINDLCPREEVALMLYKLIKANGGGFTGSWMFFWDKEDRAEVSSDCIEACMYVSMHHIMEGQTPSTFNPKNSITRSEVCQIIYNYQQKYLAE